MLIFWTIMFGFGFRGESMVYDTLYNSGVILMEFVFLSYVDPLFYSYPGWLSPEFSIIMPVLAGDALGLELAFLLG